MREDTRTEEADDSIVELVRSFSTFLEGRLGCKVTAIAVIPSAIVTLFRLQQRSPNGVKINNYQCRIEGVEFGPYGVRVQAESDADTTSASGYPVGIHLGVNPGLAVPEPS